MAYFKSPWAIERALYLAWEPRLGKTYSEVRAMIARRAMRTVIVGPKNPLCMEWTNQLRQLEGTQHIQLAEGGFGQRILDRALILQELIAGVHKEYPVVVTINYDILDEYFEPIEKEDLGYRFRKKTYPTIGEARNARANSNSKRIIDLLLDWNPEALIIDEAHLISSAGAHRSRALRRLGKTARYVRLLSGTPDPQKAPSLYAQYVVMAPHVFGTNKGKFLEKYFILNPYIRGKVEGFRSVELESEFWNKVNSLMYRVKTEDYFGPQHPNIITRDIPWNEKAASLYATLQRDSVLADEELDITIDGTHKLTKGLRSLQMCAGFVQDENSNVIRWINQEKHGTLIADIAEPYASGGFVVVSYLFTEAGERLVEEIGKAFGRDAVVLCNGKTRDPASILRIFDANAQGNTPVRVLVIQEQSGAEGISLARARHLFFHSWSMNSARHAQMTKRIWAPDRASNISYYQMLDVGKAKSADKLARLNIEDKLRASVMSR